jgi:phosphoserine aminotransferase
MTKQRVFNFSPGPAVLPVKVLERARDELLAYGDAGASVLEISHRGSHFTDILARTKHRLATLLDVPETHEILFLQGGSRLQFSMVPMNFLRGQTEPADYVVTGSWGKKAVDEARREGEVNVAWDGKSTNYDRLPATGEMTLRPGAPYVYFTSNETIQGVQFPTEPEAGGVPLVCDASSDFLHRPVPVEKYALIYACAQKNAGPAGVTVVIIRKDLLDRCPDNLPGYCNYKLHAEEDSLYNTPPTFGVYMVGLVADWLADDIGGLAAMHEINQQKARYLYDAVDESDGFYCGHARKDCRSLMNVTFRLPSDQLQEKFLAAATERQLCSLKGHRSVGGIRASIYNAMPIAGVRALRDFMVDFQKQHG